MISLMSLPSYSNVKDFFIPDKYLPVIERYQLPRLKWQLCIVRIVPVLVRVPWCIFSGLCMVMVFSAFIVPFRMKGRRENFCPYHGPGVTVTDSIIWLSSKTST